MTILNALRWVGLLWVVSLSLLPVGCGGVSSDDAVLSCGQIEPCGGNAIGSWKVINSCVNSAALMASKEVYFEASCPTATISNASETDADGGLSLNGDMSYATQGMQTLLFNLNIPSSCLNGATCASAGLTLVGGFGTGYAATCSMTGTSTCVCPFTYQNPMNDTGTYTAIGNTLVLTSAASGSTTTHDYCVQGSTLHLIDVDTTLNTGPMGLATIDDDTVFQQQ